MAAGNFFAVKNFERFQHYKDRSPPWIKLYNELLDNYEFCSLPDASKMHLVAIWLLASRSDNRLPYDAKWIGSRISATEPVNLSVLAEAGFIVPEQPLQQAEQVASKPLDQRREEERQRERQKDISSEPPSPDEQFSAFWAECRVKKSKGQALRAFRAALKKPGVTIETLIAGMRRYLAENSRTEARFLKHPATWLNGECWADEPVVAAAKPGNMAVGTAEYKKWQAEINLGNEPESAA